MKMTDSEVIDFALNYRRNVLLLEDNDPIIDSFKLAEMAGFFIIATPLKSEFDKDLERGFYKKIGSVNFIFVNTDNYKATQNFTIWHEVYHCENPFDSKILDINEDEKLAEIFAATLLLPPDTLALELVSNLNTKKIYANEIHKLSIKYKLHYKAVLNQILRSFPEELGGLGFLYANKFFEDRKHLNYLEEEEISDLYTTGHKYISKSIIDAILENRDSGIIDSNDVSNINAIIEEVFSIDK
ncbi:ImmA/IrrE family metallo-endopeptidase [Staphylococcus xylosus]|uniref:ImmA/IrrE family metallo-endopeptidase n=1 Tax=Staphylococcus xylosus TaxID=1288 RepID=UPI002DB855FD|nr:ImmA/IrrE family metallo-endopeptidase [Staphylococcus xylosus]MEB7383482.1 ImmA/IrrE family metallo-endopeptidase [Staphylococcus xylosus]